MTGPAATGRDGVVAGLLGLRVLGVGNILLGWNIRGLHRYQAQLWRLLSPGKHVSLNTTVHRDRFMFLYKIFDLSNFRRISRPFIDQKSYDNFSFYFDDF